MLRSHLMFCRKLAPLAFALASLAAGQTQSAGPTAMPPPAKGLGAPSPSQLMMMKERTFSNDPQKAQLRNEIFDYLGIKPDQGSLYVFVSSSMPKPLIQSYIAEAVWAGATLVVRGIPDGWTLDRWFKEYAGTLVDRKGITAGISIDPIMFDLYGVTAVPTIVWDETDRMIGKDCDTAKVMKPGEGMKQALVESCKTYPDQSFYAVSGAITLDYALEKFTEAGAVRSDARLAVLRKYVGEGRQEQTEFSGDWEAYETAEMRAALDRAKASGEKYDNLLQSFTQPYFESDHRRIGSGGFAPGLERGSNGSGQR